MVAPWRSPRPPADRSEPDYGRDPRTVRIVVPVPSGIIPEAIVVGGGKGHPATQGGLVEAQVHGGGRGAMKEDIPSSTTSVQSLPAKDAISKASRAHGIDFVAGPA
jgi:hypothetical protein